MEDLQSPLAKVTPVLAKKDHPVWVEILPYFTPKEFNRPYDMDVEFLRLLVPTATTIL